MSTDTTGAAHDLSGDELALVLDAACAVVFHLDVASGEVRWSGSAAALTGAGEVAGEPRGLPGARAPRRPRRAATRRSLATTPDGATSTRDLRVVWPDGSTHWLDARWRLVPDVRSGPTIVGIARQIDDERAALARDALPGRRERGARRVAGHGAHAGHRSPSCACATSATGARSTSPTPTASCATSRSRTSTPSKVELAQRMRERYPPRFARRRPATAQVVRTGEPLLHRPDQRGADGRGRARRRAPRADPLARPDVGADRAAARPRARARRDHARAHRPAPELRRGRRRLRGGGGGARRAGARQRAPVRRGARPGARLERGAGAARRARQRGADRPGLPRHRLPLRPRQRRAGRDQRGPGHRPHRAHGARGAARAGHRHRGRAGGGRWRPARRSSTCRSWARRRASPAATATTSPATTRSRSRAASGWASASPSPT